MIKKTNITVHDVLNELVLCDPDALITVCYPDPDPALKGTDWDHRFRPANWFDIQGCGKQIVVGFIERATTDDN